MFPGTTVTKRKDFSKSSNNQQWISTNQDDSMPLVSAVVENADVKYQYWLQLNEEKRSNLQDVIPQALLDQYSLMTNPFRAHLMLRC